MRSHTHKGFTLIEVLISLTILTLLAAVSLTAFVSFERREALDASVSAIAAALRDARTRTMASINGLQYGVRIDSDRFTFFQGSYVAGASTNKVFNLSSYVRASSTSATYLFSRITGNSSVSGTIDVYLASQPATKETIEVQITGLISTQ